MILRGLLLSGHNALLCLRGCGGGGEISRIIWMVIPYGAAHVPDSDSRNKERKASEDFQMWYKGDANHQFLEEPEGLPERVV